MTDPVTKVRAAGADLRRAAASATGVATGTTFGMRAINHVDGRRRLHPGAYFPPHAFGNVRDAPLRVPEGGDAASARIAAQQHQLVYAYRHARGCPSGAELGRRYGFSRQVFSVSLTGGRWLGEAVMCALLAALKEAKRP